MIQLHVRAVSGGLVSPVLVHQVQAGDPLVLGAPVGAMIADTEADRDVLCLAGGTGLAPIKAISGPDHMIVKTARVLQERGTPNGLIHYDLAPKTPENPETGQAV